jgi:cell division protein FtsB
MPLYQDYTRALSDISAMPNSMMAVKQPAAQQALNTYVSGEASTLGSTIRLDTAAKQSAFENAMGRRGLERGIRESNLGTGLAIGGIGVEAYTSKLALMKDLQRQKDNEELMNRWETLFTLIRDDNKAMRNIYNEFARNASGLYPSPSGEFVPQGGIK